MNKPEEHDAAPGGASVQGSDAQELRTHDNDVAPAEGAGRTVIIDDGSVGKQRSLWSDAWVALKKNPYFWVGSVISLFFTVMAIFPQLFTSTDPTYSDLSLSKDPPSADAWFGYDVFGADLYANVVYGAQSSMAIALIVTVSIAIIGTFVGALAGYVGGWFDIIVSRLIEIFYAIPGILGALLLLQTVFAGVDRSVFTVAGALLLFGWMTAARLVRSNVLSVREADYVAAAKVQGASMGRIITRHVLPNSIAPLIVLLTISFGMMIAAEASLSFIGIGLQLPDISWGLQLNMGRKWLQTAPHTVFIPGIAVSLAVLGFVLLGDALREALDPKGR